MKVQKDKQMKEEPRERMAKRTECLCLCCRALPPSNRFPFFLRVLCSLCFLCVRSAHLPSAEAARCLWYRRLSDRGSHV